MQDNNAQNVSSGQPSIPQTFDSPPMPPTTNLPQSTEPLTTGATPTPPMSPLTPPATPLTPSMPTAPAVTPTEYPTIPPVPMNVDSPNKKSPLVMIAVVLLVLAVLAVVAYFVGKMYLGTSSTTQTQTETLTPADIVPATDEPAAPTDDPNNPIIIEEMVGDPAPEEYIPTDNAPDGDTPPAP